MFIPCAHVLFYHSRTAAWCWFTNICNNTELILSRCSCRSGSNYFSQRDRIRAAASQFLKKDLGQQNITPYICKLCQFMQITFCSFAIVPFFRNILLLFTLLTHAFGLTISALWKIVSWAHLKYVVLPYTTPIWLFVCIFTLILVWYGILQESFVFTHQGESKLSGKVLAAQMVIFLLD